MDAAQQMAEAAQKVVAELNGQHYTVSRITSGPWVSGLRVEIEILPTRDVIEHLQRFIYDDPDA